jgi:hypothetical protein
MFGCEKQIGNFTLLSVTFVIAVGLCLLMLGKAIAPLYRGHIV